MTVKAWLDGHQFDLEDLAYLLPTGDVRVIKEGDRYYLSAPELDNPPQGKQFYEVAPDALNRVNAIGRLNRPEFQPVKLAMQFETDHGHHHHVVVKGAAISRSKAYGVLVSANGQVQIPPPPGPDQVRVAHTHPDAAQALEILGTSSALGWVELYKVFEIVRDAVKPTKLNDAGLADTRDITALSVLSRTCCPFGQADFRWICR